MFCPLLQEPPLSEHDGKSVLYKDVSSKMIYNNNECDFG